MIRLPRRNAFETENERPVSAFEALVTLVVCFLLVCAAAYAAGGTP